MNLRTKSLVATGLLCTTAFWVAWRESQSLQTDRMALVAVAKKHVDLEAQVRREEERAASLEREGKALQVLLDGLQSLPKKATPTYKPVQLVEPAEAAMLRVMATGPWQDIALQNNPGLRTQYLASERTNLAVRYGPFLQSLGLAPEQADRFKDLMTEHAERLLDSKLIARAPGVPESDRASATLVQQADEQLSAAQLDLLGEAGYQQLQQYERTLPVRGQITALAGALALTDTPLSTGQAEQITQIVANASKGYQNGGKADVPMPGNGEPLTPLMFAHQTIEETIDWGTVLTQSRGVLSDAQFALFEAYVTKDRSVVQLFNLMQQSSEDPMVGFAFGRR